MLPRFNILIEWLCRWYLRGVTLSQRYIDTARELLGKGTLFYVIRDRSYYEAIAFNYLLRKNELPLVPFAGNLRLWRLAPLLKLLGEFRDWLLRLLRLAPGRPGYRERLTRTVREGGHGLIFLKRSRSILREFWQGNDPYAILIEEARHTARPIYLLPQFAIVSQHPDLVKPKLPSKFLGSEEEPRLIRRFFQALKAYRQAKLECGAPIEVQKFLAGNPGVPDAILVRKLKLALLQEFAAERRVYAGPKLRDRLDLKGEILRSPALYDFMLAQAQREGVSKEEILRRADDILDKMASDPSLNVAVMLKRVLFFGLKRSYESFEVDQEGLEGVKAALKEGPVILLPNHSSHVDYLILSCLFHNEHLVLPHIAAGDNLNFWPMGPIFRRGSAFFIRRSFRGDRLYTQIFDTYLNYLLSEGFPIEFFVEGTRSRNGKLRPPQLGMLSRIVGSYAQGSAPKLTFVPVGIDYERIFEESAYRRELEGASKGKESFKGLLKLPSMIGADRGHIYLRFGEGIDMAAFARQQGLNPAKPNERRELTRRLGEAVVQAIQRERTVTSSALVAAAVLSRPHAPASFEEVVARGEFFRKLLLRQGTPLGVGQEKGTKAAGRKQALRKAVDRLLKAEILLRSEHEGKEILTVAPEQYLVLDYYRNSLVNPLASYSLAANLILKEAARSAGDGAKGAAFDAAALEGPFEWLGSLLSGELTGTPKLSEGLEGLAETGCVKNGMGPAQVADPEKLRSAASVTRAILEGYLAVTAGLERLGEDRIERQALFPYLHKEAQALYVASRLSHRDLLTTAVVDRAVEMLAERGVLDREEKTGGPPGGLLLVREAETLPAMSQKIEEVLR